MNADTVLERLCEPFPDTTDELISAAARLICRLKLEAKAARAAAIEDCVAVANSMSGHTHLDIAARLRALSVTP